MRNNYGRSKSFYETGLCSMVKESSGLVGGIGIPDKDRELMENSFVQRLLPIFLVACGSAYGSVDYCNKQLFSNVTRQNLMGFSKENSEREFAVVDGFKSLSCCSHGYRSIEWFKNGIPYPWSSDVSTLIISPESGNQTIYSQVVSDMDSGEYWCIVRNDSHSLRHDVLLKVTGLSGWEEPPKATFKPRDETVDLGQDARFYCAAFVGNGSSSDARSEIGWMKSGANSTIQSNGRVRQVESREENQVLGCYLFISDVREEDFGEYICRVYNTGGQYLDLNASLLKEDKTLHSNYGISPMKGTIIIASLLILSAALSAISLVLFSSHFKSIYRRYFQKSYSKRNREYDVLVVYHEKDKEFALNKIVFTLQNSYYYKCKVQSVTFNKLDSAEIREKSNNSQRLILLLSSALTENEWSCRKLNLILRNVINIHPMIITVLMQPLPLNDPPGDASALQEKLQRVYCIEYQENKIQRFWDLMSLGLPNFNGPSESGENVELV